MKKENETVLEIEKKIIEFNAIDAKIKELDQNLALLEKQINELQLCNLALDEIKKMKKDTEMLSSISPGVFTKSKLLDNSEVIIDIGSKVLCKKKIEDAKKIIQTKLDQSIEVRDRLINELNILIQSITRLEKEIRENKLNF